MGGTEAKVTEVIVANLCRVPSSETVAIGGNALFVEVSKKSPV